MPIINATVDVVSTTVGVCVSIEFHDDMVAREFVAIELNLLSVSWRKVLLFVHEPYNQVRKFNYF